MVEGPQVGVPCKFPFSISALAYTFHECTDMGDMGTGFTFPGILLCATEVDDDGYAIKSGICDTTCLSGMNNRLFLFKSNIN